MEAMTIGNIFSPLEIISKNGYYNCSLERRIRYESEKVARGNDFTANLAICLALQRKKSIARNTCLSLRLNTIALERIARAVAAKCNASSRRLRAP